MSDTDANVTPAARISSPEQLTDYLKVTTPKIWVLLVAVILLIIGFLFWSTSTVIESYAIGTAQVSAGEVTMTFEDQNKAQKIKAGMEMEIGEDKVEIQSVGTNAQGEIFATAQAHIPDGAYNARVGYNATQAISMLMN